jgi:hypothetical protein
MRALLVGVIGLGMIGFAAPSQAADNGGSCSVALQTLGQQWDAMGFAAPQKPSQAVVYGRGGHTVTGAEYQQMQTGMRFAAQDCAAGREDAALRRIQSIQATLSNSHNG